MPLDTYTKHLLLDHLASLVTRISLHSTNPGTEPLASDNPVGEIPHVARQIPIWAPAAGLELSLAENIVFTKASAFEGVNINWVALWDNQSTPVRYGVAEFATPQTFNQDGIFVLTTGLRFRFPN